MRHGAGRREPSTQGRADRRGADRRDAKSRRLWRRGAATSAMARKLPERRPHCAGRAQARGRPQRSEAGRTCAMRPSRGNARGLRADQRRTAAQAEQRAARTEAPRRERRRSARRFTAPYPVPQERAALSPNGAERTPDRRCEGVSRAALSPSELARSAAPERSGTDARPTQRESASSVPALAPMATFS